MHTKKTNQKFITVMENLHLFELSSDETGYLFWNEMVRGEVYTWCASCQIPQNSFRFLNFRNIFFQKEAIQNLFQRKNV